VLRRKMIWTSIGWILPNSRWYLLEWGGTYSRRKRPLSRGVVFFVRTFAGDVYTYESGLRVVHGRRYEYYGQVDQLAFWWFMILLTFVLMRVYIR
jgi:hypothetical protein